jgi:hypothetical protein
MEWWAESRTSRCSLLAIESNEMFLYLLRSPFLPSRDKAAVHEQLKCGRWQGRLTIYINLPLIHACLFIPIASSCSKDSLLFVESDVILDTVITLLKKNSILLHKEMLEPL